MRAVEFIKQIVYISTMCQALKWLRKINLQATTEVFQCVGLFRDSDGKAIFIQFMNNYISNKYIKYINISNTNCLQNTRQMSYHPEHLAPQFGELIKKTTERLFQQMVDLY